MFVVMKKYKRVLEISQEDGYKEVLKSTINFLKRKIIEEPMLGLSRILIGNWVVTRTINGSKMRLNFNPKKPHKIERELFLNGFREPGATDTFSEILFEIKKLERDVHVFDIGSNIGYFVLLEAKILGEEDQIYAIEAEPINAERLERNVNLNNYKNVDILQIAAGSERARLEMSRRKSSNLHRMSEVLGDKEVVDTIEVEVQPIDLIIKNKEISEDEPIIIRMDVEGYEKHVFDGMEEFLSSNRPSLIMVELHPNGKNVIIDEIIDIFEEGDFKPEFISTDGGDTYQKLDSLEEARKINSNSHLIVKRGL